MDRPKWISHEEYWPIITGKSGDKPKQMASFRLSEEALRIIEEAGEMVGDKTKALELMTRLWREEIAKPARKGKKR